MGARVLLAVAVAFVAGAVCAGGAAAATFEASSTQQLVEAVGKANANESANTIILKGGTYLPAKKLTFTNTHGVQTIEGPTAFPAAKVVGSSVEPFPSELFFVEKGVSVVFKDLAETGGGGPGVPTTEVFGSLTVERSIMGGNNDTSIVVQTGGTLTVRDSTLSENFNSFGVVNGGTASFFNSTVAFNQGGVENNGTLNLTNTIVAENVPTGDCTGQPPGTADHSLDSDGSCHVGALSKVNPLLGPLETDGGPTQIHSLRPGSPAIDAGDKATCTAMDQRGQPRPDLAATACDIGADEYNETPPTLTLPANITTPATGPEGAVVTYKAEASSSDDTIKSLTCSPESGSTFAMGKTTVMCTAEDGHQTKKSGSFTVTVTSASPTAPVVETKAAGSVTPSGATLNATVNPKGAEITECKFEYGTSAAYGASAPCSKLPGSGTSPVAVSATVSGLGESTTYHYRIVAVNSGGIGDGSDTVFETLAAGPSLPGVTTGAASTVMQGAATLNAMVNPNGGEVTECKFEYGTTSSYGASAPCDKLPGKGTSAVSVSATVSGLGANTTYHYRMVAANAAGQGKGSDETFKTLPPAPVVETGAATAVTQGAATLNAAVNPNGGEVTECKFEYGTTPSYGSSVPCSKPPGLGTSSVAVSATASGLAAATTYHFRIVATNAGGQSKGADATLLTQAQLVQEVKSTQKPAGSMETPKAGVQGESSSKPVPPAAKVSSTSFTVSKAGTLGVPVACPAGATSCLGAMTVRTLTAVVSRSAHASKSKKAILTLATASFSLSGGQSKTITLRLSAKAKKLLSRSHVLRARITVSSHDPAGESATTSAVVTLRLRK
jgi:hypothetical protein